MLIDMHAHTSGISWCCQASAMDILKTTKERGIDGIVLTNHYQKYYVENGDAAAFARRYVDEYHYTKSCGDELGMPVIYGMEVTMHQHEDVHILVYGVEPEFTLQYPEVYDMTLPELYALVHRHGGMLVQAHPFRNGIDALQDLAYLDGVEANSHQVYDATHVLKLSEIARSKKLILTSGGDYHSDAPRPHCGAYLPDDIDSPQALRRFLMTTESLDIQVQEPGEAESYRVTYHRNGK